MKDKVQAPRRTPGPPLGMMELSDAEVLELRSALESDIGRTLGEFSDDEIRAGAYRTLRMLQILRDAQERQPENNYHLI